MEKVQSESVVTMNPTTFGAGKPVAPFTERHVTNPYRSMDPSSSIRADRYPIPNSFNYISTPRNREIV